MRSFVLLRYPKLALLKVLCSINSANTVITLLQSQKKVAQKIILSKKDQVPRQNKCSSKSWLPWKLSLIGSNQNMPLNTFLYKMPETCCLRCIEILKRLKRNLMKESMILKRPFFRHTLIMLEREFKISRISLKSMAQLKWRVTQREKQ